MTSAAARGLVACSECALVTRPVTPSAPGFCPRCGERLAFRRENAIQRTWALLVAAAILYVPANVLPVLTTTTVVSSESDTIMSGVILLYATGSWPLALIVLVASIVIPIGKIVTLAFVLVTVQRGMATSNRQRTRLYRTVEFIGRWSMLDVFVDTFVVALVQLSPLMSVEPGPGVVYFMAVVVLTMFAAQSFDPRLDRGCEGPPRGTAAPPPGAASGGSDVAASVGVVSGGR
jgi:paraquat-inducible protein A